MRIAIVSDTHSKTPNTLAAIDLIRARSVNCILHCGDICDPETVALFAGFSAHFVQGNNDYDLEQLRAAAERIGASFHGPFSSLEIAQKRIALLHGHDWNLLDRVQAEQTFDYVFFGHLHEFSRNQVGRTTVINPGALHRARPKSFVIVDLATGEFERLQLPDDPTPRKRRDRY
jgi:uncharacterized protein